MPLVLPRQVDGSASGWALRDFVQLIASTDPAAGGTAVLEFPQLDPDEMLLVDHAVVLCTSTTPSSVRLYTGAVDPLRILDGSAAGNFDVADWDGLQLHPSTTLIVQWSGCSPGAVGTITIQARSMRR